MRLNKKSAMLKNNKSKKGIIMRIGPKMKAVKFYVENNPGKHIYFYAQMVAPHGTGIGYGYQTVKRALRAGIVKAIPGDRTGTRKLIAYS